MLGPLRFTTVAVGLFAVFFVAAPAIAQVDVESIAFYRSVDTVNGGAESESARFEIVVRGTGITSATLTKPDDDVETLVEDAVALGTWSASFDFVDEAALEVDYPGVADSYTLDLNGGARVIELTYDVPGLPDFAISSPIHESDNNSPSTTEFDFTSCAPAECTNDDDHVMLGIDRGVSTIAAGVEDDPGAGSWIPVDVDDVPIVLPENADMDFTAELAAWRTHFEIADLTDAFTFFNVFFRADSVDFSTGFKGLDEAPVGPFSIASNDPAAGILITSGPLTASIGGIDLDFDYTMNQKGKINGTGDADVDSNGSFETPVVVTGKLSGKDATPTQKINIKVKNKEEATQANAKYKRIEAFDLVAGTSVRDESLKGKVLGVKVVAEDTNNDVIAGVMTDWQVDFTLSTVNGKAMIVSDANIVIGGGTPIPLEGGGKYNSTKQSTQLTLKSTGDLKGIQVKVKDLTVDEDDMISGGSVRLRAYGQTVNIDLTPPAP